VVADTSCEVVYGKLGLSSALRAFAAPVSKQGGLASRPVDPEGLIGEGGGKILSKLAAKLHFKLHLRR